MQTCGRESNNANERIRQKKSVKQLNWSIWRRNEPRVRYKFEPFAKEVRDGCKSD